MANLIVVSFLALASVVGILLISVLKGIASTMRDMSQNLVALNDKMIAVVYRVDNHETRLSAVEKRP